MEKISREELVNLELVTDAQISEYRIELVKAKARFDAELYYKNSLALQKLIAHKSFLYSLFSGVIGLCLGFWISYLTK